MESTAAILLRRTKFSDTSLIITWLTLDHGKLKTMAKGALGRKSPFAGALDLFFETEISFVRSQRSELHTLREAVLREPFEGLRKDYARVELGSYFIELLEMTTEPEHPVPELFELLRRALRYLESATPSRRALVHFENELARLLGIHDEGNASTALWGIGQRLPESRRRLMEKLK
jgi:DNA repair protein RecO (recombination protein O)